MKPFIKCNLVTVTEYENGNCSLSYEPGIAIRTDKIITYGAVEIPTSCFGKGNRETFFKANSKGYELTENQEKFTMEMPRVFLEESYYREMIKIIGINETCFLKDELAVAKRYDLSPCFVLYLPNCEFSDFSHELSLDFSW